MMLLDELPSSNPTHIVTNTIVPWVKINRFAYQYPYTSRVKSLDGKESWSTQILFFIKKKKFVTQIDKSWQANVPVSILNLNLAISAWFWYFVVNILSSISIVSGISIHWVESFMLKSPNQKRTQSTKLFTIFANDLLFLHLWLLLLLYPFLHLFNLFVLHGGFFPCFVCF